jgi:hypothetical protein
VAKMNKASQLVEALLETDEPADVNIEPDVDPLQFVAHHADELDREAREGKVTPYTAMTANHFWHREVTYSDGIRHYEVRRNGRTQTWKTRPGEFRIPIKIGFRGYGEITHRNADEWSTIPVPDNPRPMKPPRKKPVVNPSDIMPPPTI